MSYDNFSSMPPEQERHFVVFEKRTQEDSSKAFTIGAISGAVVFVLLTLLYCTSEAPENIHADALDEDEKPTEMKKEKKKPAPTPDPAKTNKAAPSGTEGAAAPAANPQGAADTAAAGAGKTPAEMPKPPKGATKAPPTAITGGK